MVKTVKVCANCGSPNIQYTTYEVMRNPQTSAGTGQNYYCNACGYCGAIILEIDRNRVKEYIKERKGAVKKQHKDKKIIAKQIWSEKYYRFVRASTLPFLILFIIFFVLAALVLSGVISF